VNSWVRPAPGCGPRGACTYHSGVPTRSPLPSGRLLDSVGIAEQIVALLTSGVVVLDERDRVVMANHAALGLGVVRGGRLDATVLSALVRAVRADGQTREREVTLPARAEPPLRLPRRDRAGPSARVRVMSFPDGEIVIVLDDVTEAHRVEAVRRDFVANVSHELKTPVGALSLLAEAINESSDDPASVRRFAERMTVEARRLSRLVQELIDLSRLQSGEAPPRMLPVPVSRVLQEAIDRTRLAAQSKGIAVVVVPHGEGELVLRGDEGQLSTAVANLLENAVSYSPEGTRVVLGVCARDAEVEISVADEGIGIAEGDLERVFERFYRADPARSRSTGGTGLGLAIVKHIATNHGGSVSVWSSEGAGSTFTLRLPGVPPDAPPGAPPDAPPDGREGSVPAISQGVAP
jgi:two-component system sensor histidine kinase SenX3